MEYLALEVFDLSGSGSQFANLPDDSSITITDTSELFDSGNIWSHPFVLNVFANPHIFGTTGDLHGGRLHEQIDKRRARLWVMGLPLYYGYLRLGDEVDIEENGNVDVSFESGRKTFAQMTEGVKANQVPVTDDILIGMAVDRERTLERNDAVIRVTSPIIEERYEEDGIGYDRCKIKGTIENFAQMYPKFVQPYGEWTEKDGARTLSIPRNDTVNIDVPYDEGHPYCNTRICYQRKVWRSNNGSLEKQAMREYKISEPGRINPAPNFFVLYWIKMLMKHLGIIVSENQMLGVEDLKRLFFVNTKCSYLTKDEGRYKAVESNGADRYFPLGPSNPFVPTHSSDEPSWELKGTLVSGPLVSRREGVTIANVGHGPLPYPEITWQPAYATSDNFPNTDIKDVIEAIENGFGVRLMFNEDYTSVRIVLLRNIFRSQEVHDMPGVTIEESKTENCIRGFRLTYGGEDDTTFHYKGFDQAKQNADGGWLTEADTHDYSQFDMSLGYEDIMGKVGMLNKTCYVDAATGNAYIVKIDENFKNASEQANPSLFECAQWMDAEDGDCTGEEETIKEIRVGFTPMVANAIRDSEKKYSSYALFVNEEMGVPADTHINSMRGSIQPGIPGGESLITDDANCTLVKQEIRYLNGLYEIATATSAEVVGENGTNLFTIPLPPIPGGRGKDMTYSIRIEGWIRDGYRLYLEDNYEPGEDLECPLEKPDWGLMLGLMRGSNSGNSSATIKYSPDDVEDEGNDTWEIAPGAIAAAHSDTCDDYGNPWDYRPKVPVSGNTYGDYVISGADGFPDNIRGRKGPEPGGLDVMAVIDSYYRSQGSELSVITEQGYYACDFSFTCQDGNTCFLWLCCVYDGTLRPYSFMEDYFHNLCWGGATESESMRAADIAELVSRDAYNLIVFATPTAVEYSVLQEACNAYLEGNGGSYDMPSSDVPEDRNGHVSLKLRAEKPNPHFDPKLPESSENPRYLEITNPALRRRGLIDQFHKEESYWWRNARITKKRRIMEIADIRNIDKTVRQNVDDVTGFVRKLQYTVNIQTGLSPVDFEIWYL